MFLRHLFRKQVETTVENGIVLHVADSNCKLLDIGIYINRRIDSWSEFHAMWDFRNYNFEDIDLNAVSKFVQFIGKPAAKRAELKSALLVGSNLAFGLSRMFQTLAESQQITVEIGIFHDKQEALDGLNS